MVLELCSRLSIVFIHLDYIWCDGKLFLSSVGPCFLFGAGYFFPFISFMRKTEHIYCYNSIVNSIRTAIITIHFVNREKSGLDIFMVYDKCKYFK